MYKKGSKKIIRITITTLMLAMILNCEIFANDDVVVGITKGADGLYVGDLNKDGYIDDLDMRYFNYIIKNQHKKTNCSNWMNFRDRADLNRDSRIDTKDKTLLETYFAKVEANEIEKVVGYDFYDINCDRRLDKKDYDYCVFFSKKEKGTKSYERWVDGIESSDFNNDGNVDEKDIKILAKKINEYNNAEIIPTNEGSIVKIKELSKDEKINKLIYSAIFNIQESIIFNNEGIEVNKLRSRIKDIIDHHPELFYYKDADIYNCKSETKIKFYYGDSKEAIIRKKCAFKEMLNDMCLKDLFSIKEDLITEVTNESDLSKLIANVLDNKQTKVIIKYDNYEISLDYLYEKILDNKYDKQFSISILDKDTVKIIFNY